MKYVLIKFKKNGLNLEGFQSGEYFKANYYKHCNILVLSQRLQYSFSHFAMTITLSLISK